MQAPTRNAFDFPSNVPPGAHWSLTFTRGDKLRNQLYFPDKERGASGKSFQQLVEAKLVVEPAMGHGLSWDTEPTRKVLRYRGRDLGQY